MKTLKTWDMFNELNSSTYRDTASKLRNQHEDGSADDRANELEEYANDVDKITYSEDDSCFYDNHDKIVKRNGKDMCI